MKTKGSIKIVGGPFEAFKMPGWAYGLPAAECKTGSKLAQQPNTVCSGCYALKGCYVFPVVQAAQYRRLKAIGPRCGLEHGAINQFKNQKNLDGMIRGRTRRRTPTQNFCCCKLTPDTSTGCQRVSHG
ncbi:MAG: hypothetical protein CM15mV127_060 [Caudoviricetes sp.]|nr:MAG: hypothetical protein CM15mV127_060 [Caudoviricetes sp.]